MKYAAGVWIFGGASDRYVSCGYRERPGLEERLDMIAGVGLISGVEVTYPGDVDETSAERFRKMVRDRGMDVAALGVELVCEPRWQTGSLASANRAVRASAISRIKAAMNMAPALGVSTVCLWLGQDGVDYPFQGDYPAMWRRLVDGLAECASHKPGVRLAVEYKNREPRMSCLVNSAGTALALAMATGMPNVGALMDVGHSFNAGEMPAEAASLLLVNNRLFHLHLNDNYGTQDDDMPVGSVHWPEYMELLYWLDRLGYDGWYSLDLYPYRDDPVEACRASIDFIEGARRLVLGFNPPGDGSDEGETGRPRPSAALRAIYRRAFER